MDVVQEDDRNEVVVRGRVSQDPERRELPSGDEVWVFRLVVRRPAVRGATEGAVRRATVDALECAAFAARPRRSVAGWGAGDVVEVEGALRRRFYRAGAGAQSVTEIEVERGRLIRRAASA